MKVTAALLLNFFMASFLYAYGQQYADIDGWNIPLSDGGFSYMSQEAYDQMASEYSLDNSETKILGYYLFTRDNAEEPQSLATHNMEALQGSYFHAERPTRIIIHGWLQNYMSEINALLRSAFLDTGDYNVISVDYSWDLLYPATALAIPDLGKDVAHFIDFLHREAGMSFETLLVAGFSLGAQIAGFAGKNVQEGRIQQIIAMDPAMPLFLYDDPSDRLNEDDAVYVESIQTCGGRLGYVRPIGKAAFYPNGGVTQPNCIESIACSHGRSYIYYAEAVRLNNFDSVRCYNYEQAAEHHCGRGYSGIKMGAPTNIDNAEGVFYVPVNGDPPYGRGR